jgi:multicomponent Na+:H+ antiporter subunit B
MPSLILSTTARLLLPLLLSLSVFLLLRGHNEPGGGFVGGLVAATGFALYALAFDVATARSVLRVDPGRLAALGLGVALSSGLAGLLAGRPFLTGLWVERAFPVIGKLGTPLLFDVGVFMVVLGITLVIVFALVEE